MTLNLRRYAAAPGATAPLPLSAREPPRGLGLRAVGASQVCGTIAALGLTPRPTNPLLVRDNVGKPRSSTFDLPEDGFAYGRPTNDDVEGAREVCMRWVAHTPSKQREVDAPDFVDFNRRAAAARVTTSKDARHFHKECDLSPRSAQALHGSPGKALIPSDVIPGFTYGRKVRPSTPIQEVISARFADRAEKQLDRFYAEMSEAREMSKMQVNKIHQTAASRGHATGAKKAMQLEDPKALFKLSRFTRIGSKVDRSRRKIGDVCEDPDFLADAMDGDMRLPGPSEEPSGDAFSVKS